MLVQDGDVTEERFPNALRLRKRREFLKVQEGGERVTSGPLLALVVLHQTGETRLGITVSKKIGTAVERNRVRRRLREIFRRNRALLPGGLDLVFVARSGAAEAKFEELHRAFEAVALKLRGRFA